MKYLTDREKKIKQALICPVCKAGMQVEVSGSGASLVCIGERRHCFDFSSEGYVNLSFARQSGGGDSREAVRARSAFLGTDAYRPVAQALTDTLVNLFPEPSDTLLVDAGCGEGYYSAFLAQKGFSVIGADISKFAVQAASKRATRNHLEHAFYTVASVFELPIADSSADVVINVFAPCAESEYTRILKDGGFLIVVYAGSDHLMGLKQALYENVHGNTGRADLPVGLEKTEEKRVKFRITVKENSMVRNLFAMTPYYWRTSPQDCEKLADLDTLTTDVDMMIAVYRKKEQTQI